MKYFIVILFLCLACSAQEVTGQQGTVQVNQISGSAAVFVNTAQASNFFASFGGAYNNVAFGLNANNGICLSNNLSISFSVDGTNEFTISTNGITTGGPLPVIYSSNANFTFSLAGGLSASGTAVSNDNMTSFFFKLVVSSGTSTSNLCGIGGNWNHPPKVFITGASQNAQVGSAGGMIYWFNDLVFETTNLIPIRILAANAAPFPAGTYYGQMLLIQ